MGWLPVMEAAVPSTREVVVGDAGGGAGFVQGRDGGSRLLQGRKGWHGVAAATTGGGSKGGGDVKIGEADSGGDVRQGGRGFCRHCSHVDVRLDGGVSHGERGREQEVSGGVRWWCGVAGDGVQEGGDDEGGRWHDGTAAATKGSIYGGGRWCCSCEEREGTKGRVVGCWRWRRVASGGGISIERGGSQRKEREAQRRKNPGIRALDEL